MWMKCGQISGLLGLWDIRKSDGVDIPQVVAVFNECLPGGDNGQFGVGR
jgi:hypothetical protein